METLIASALILIAQVETNGRDLIGDNGQAVGVLQIHLCVIEDVNAIYGTEYTLEDRNCPTKSREIATLYLRHYGKRAQTIYDLGRIWNGGPRGMLKASTDGYVEKMRRLNKEVV